MANTNTPWGFPCWGNPIRVREYSVDADAGTIYQNAMVMMEDDGYVAPATAGATNGLLGSALGYHLTGTAGTILIADHPEQLFIAQEDGDSVTSAQTYVGLNCDLISTESPTGLVDACELDLSGASTATAQFRILELAPMIDAGAKAANAWGDYAKLIVQINEHFLKRTTGI